MKGDTYKNWRKNIWKYITSDWFDASKSFITLPCFWAAIISVTSISLFVYLKIYLNNDLALCWEGDCVNYWASKFKVPIGIMALLIPILGLLNANHKSEQTRKQIEISSSQNNLSNYYKHIDEFEKYGHRLEKSNYIIDFRRLHTKIYPEAKKGIFAMSGNEVSSLLDECIAEARLFSSDDESTFFQAEELIIFHLEDFLRNHSDYLIYRSELSEDVKIMKTFGGDKNYLRSLKEVLAIAEIFHYVWCFDTNYDRSLLKKIIVLKKVLSWQKGYFGDKTRKPIHIVKELIHNGYIFTSGGAKQKATAELMKKV